MATKITQEDIIKMNDLYLQLHTYAAVARVVGVSPTTVKRYIKPDYKPFDASKEVKFTLDMLPPIGSGIVKFRGIDNYGSLCIMSDEEFKEVKEELTKEIRQ